MRPGMAVSITLCLLLVSALFADTQTIELSITPNEKLITASGDLNFPGVLPGYNYTGTIKVRWAIPSESLAKIQATEIPVYVRAWVPADGAVILTVDGKSGKEVVTSLNCVLENGACGNGSVLEKEIRVFAAGTGKSNFTGNVSIEASLNKFQLPGTSQASGQPGLADSFNDIAGSISGVLGNPESSGNAGGGNASAGGTSENKSEMELPELSENGSNGAENFTSSPLFPLAAVLIVALIIVAGYFLSKKQD